MQRKKKSKGQKDRLKMKEKNEEKSSFYSDLPSILLLLFLYFLQGIPFGLSGTLDLTMQEGGKLSYEEQGIYSSVSWPYSLKMLWAPLVDSLFIKGFGRRKTWLIPVQFLIGFILIYFADQIPELMGETTQEKPKIFELTLLFFTFFLLCATQDIAVDGWALEMLSKKNVAWASTCNSIGLTAGYTVSFQGFLVLKSWDLCDFPQFMKLFGWIFVLTTILVGIMKKESLLEEAPGSIKLAYQQTYQVCKLKAVQLLLLALITRSIAFAPSDTLTTRKLLENGLKKESIATIAALLTPISIILPGILGRYVNDKPLSLFIRAYKPRIILSILSALLIYFCPSDLKDSTPLWFWIAMFVLSIIGSIISTAQFVSLMAFFAKVSDPLVGGSYMTTLNTATNLGSKWPNTLVLFAVNPLSMFGIDGYYLLTSFAIIFGFFWIDYFSKKLYNLELLPESNWRVPRKNSEVIDGESQTEDSVEKY